MKKFISLLKIPILALFFVICCLLLASCFSPWRGNNATITISLGSDGSARAAAYPPEGTVRNELDIQIQMNGPGGTDIFSFPKDRTSIVRSVVPGRWDITVEASRNGEEYAKGSVSVEIKAGENNSITVPMFRPVPAVVITGDKWERGVLTAAVTGLSASPSLIYEWKEYPSGIILYTGPSFTVTAASRGKTIYVELQYPVNDMVVNSDPVAIHPGIPISNRAELEGIEINLTTMDGLNDDYILIDNITLSGSWTPIVSSTAYGRSFNGTFDGNGKTITMNALVSSVNSVAGLFGFIGSGTVKNLKLAGSMAITASDQLSFIGAVAGQNSGTIRNVSSSVMIELNGNTWSAGSVQYEVGGIVGRNWGIIENSYCTGSVTSIYSGPNTGISSSINNAGGISGNNGIPGVSSKNCWTSGTVVAFSSGDVTPYAGGIVGNLIGGEITGCVALNPEVTISGSGTYKGRITGNSGGTLSNNYARSDMDDGLGSPFVGGTHNNWFGENINPAQYESRSWWQGVGFLFGADESNPWVWDNTARRPKLWFE